MNQPIPIIPKSIFWISLALFLSCCIPMNGQDLEQTIQNLKNIREQKLHLNGGLNLSNAYYFSDGIDPRRDALQWRLQARLNLRFLNINAPFSLNFSDGNQQFGLPSYTFVGLSPRYKWATMHLGDRSLNFSRYTLAGINFRGIGTEIQPGSFRFSAMYGRLRRAVAEDLNSRQSLDPAYERWGWGFKAGYATPKQEYHLIFFTAWDDKNSIVNPVDNPLTPAENTILSLTGRQKIAKNLNLNLEFARSGYNKNQNAPAVSDANFNSSQTLFGLFTPNSSASIGNAYRAGLNYNLKGFSFQTGYERIDRGYRTLGAIFFNNDQDNITAGISKSFLQNKLYIFLNGGLERTNLDEAEQIKTQRWIGSANMSYTPNATWSFSGNYSNFQNATKLRALSDPTAIVDSIFLAQLTQTIGAVATHTFGSKRNPSTLSLILSQQQANSIVEDEIQEDISSSFYNGSLIYTRTIKDQDMQYNASLNINNSDFNALNTLTFSPTLGLRKQFLNRQLQTDLRTTFNAIFQNGTARNQVWNFSIGADYRFLLDHSIGLNTVFLHRTASTNDAGSFSEIYGRILYGYRFSNHKRNTISQ